MTDPVAELRSREQAEAVAASAAREGAAVEYRAALWRRARGQSQKNDAAVLSRTMAILGKSVDDVGRDASIIAEALPAQEVATDAAAANEAAAAADAALEALRSDFKAREEELLRARMAATERQRAALVAASRLGELRERHPRLFE